MPDVALIILAAGNSSRLGQAKQLKAFKGKTLLERIVDAGIESDCRYISVVLGADFDAIANLLKSKDLKIVKNDNWSEGMGSSIAAAAATLKEIGKLDAVIISVCDQPYSSARLFNKMIETFIESKDRIVACKYGDTIGTPALFPARLFSDLANLKGPEGGRKIWRDRGEEPVSIDFPEGSFDIDTQEDWAKFLADNGGENTPG
ncbi:MAG: nucleotidyltransferase family protein [Cyanobacteria bacterium]|nr:nucleotidyltransferase family protein [Cyanobacteriota bacterium]